MDYSKGPWGAGATNQPPPKLLEQMAAHTNEEVEEVKFLSIIGKAFAFPKTHLDLYPNSFLTILQSTQFCNHPPISFITFHFLLRRF